MSSNRFNYLCCRYDLTAMESLRNNRIGANRQVQFAQSQTSKLKLPNTSNNNHNFSSRRGLIDNNVNRRNNVRRNRFSSAVGANRYNNQPQNNAIRLKQALLRRQQIKRQQQKNSQFKNRRKINSLNNRMKLAPSNRYTRKIDSRRDDAPRYDSPPNIMQNHYDKEYSSTFNEPSRSPTKRPFDPPNIFTQGHPGETRYMEQGYGGPNVQSFNSQGKP